MPHIVPIAEKSPDDRFAIVVAKWNESVTAKLLDGAVDTLKRAGVADSRIEIAWVPGAWELPVIVARFANSGRFQAVIALGAVVRGETSHDRHINRSVGIELARIATQSGIPVLFGVLTCETMEQAIHRAGGNVGNKGVECAEAALHMVGLLRTLDRGA